MKIATGTIMSPIDIQYIREWACHNLRMGVSRMYMGLNDFTDEEAEFFRRTVQDMIADGSVVTFAIDGLSRLLECNAISMRMAMEDGFDFIALIDIDEFIAIHSDRTLEQILGEHREHPSVAVHWRLAGSNGHLHELPFPVQERFTRCARRLNRHLKPFVNLSYFRRMCIPLPSMDNPHFVMATTIDVSRGYQTFGCWDENNLDMPREVELIHYATKSRDECMVRRTYRRCDIGIPTPCGWEKFFKEHDINEIEIDTIAEIVNAPSNDIGRTT